MIELLRKFGFVPRVAVWELTLACNLHCRHCGSRAGKARDDELTLPEALTVAKDLAALGCRFLTLSGGEPLLRKDWPLIAETAIEGGIRTGMISNGDHFDKGVAQLMRTIGLDSVAFSVDGFEAAHEYQRRVPGHFARVIRAIDTAVAGGMAVSVITTINNRNMTELEELRVFLHEHGVTRWQLQFATAVGNMADNTSLLIAPEDLLTLVPLIARMRQDGALPKVYPGHDVGYYGEPEEGLRDPRAKIPFWTGCSAGCSVIGIESNGNIKGCLSLPSSRNDETAFVEGSVRQTPLRELWNRPGAFAYNREYTKDLLGGYCAECEYSEICRGGCTWSAYADHGFVRDNEYCYHRQVKAREARAEGRELPRAPRRLPIAH